jgi:two-component system, NarL family, captular synthesis response regulator RcsB
MPGSAVTPRFRSRSRSDPTCIAVLDDHPVVLCGLEARIRAEPDFHWVTGVATSSELIRVLERKPCHVVVLDYELAPNDLDGWSLVRLLRARLPHVRLVMSTAHNDKATATLMRRAGAHGFVAKSDNMDVLVAAVRHVMNGGEWYEDGVADLRHTEVQVVQHHLPFETLEAGRSDVRILSPREHEVIRCCLQGLSVGQIAVKFSRSVKTVSTQKQSAYRKLGIRNDLELYNLHRIPQMI